MIPISNVDLTLADVPPVDASMDTICDFAHTFDGYEYWGSFTICAEVANARRHATLSEVRTCLFFEHRRERHTGDPIEGQEEIYVRSLIERIRAMVLSNDRK